ncbi:MAG: hypothetical protein ABJA82_13965 [Myxococcales bacterium]
MPGVFKEWTVLPHSKLTRVEDDLLTVTGNLPMPMGEFPRRMIVVRLRDGRCTAPGFAPLRFGGRQRRRCGRRLLAVGSPGDAAEEIPLTIPVSDRGTHGVPPNCVPQKFDARPGSEISSPPATG